MDQIVQPISIEAKNTVEIVVHIKEDLGEGQQKLVVSALEKTDGIIGAEFCILRNHLMLVKYENLEHARKGLNLFHDAYLPEYTKENTAGSVANSPGLFKLEDGWLAYKLLGEYLAIVFECPDQESARTIIQKNESNLLKKEGK